jgi:hypothetical protein
MNDDLKLEKTLSLQVSVQIIKHISRGLYRSAASALKELVSNSFDADAKNVIIRWKFSHDNYGILKLRSIEVEDNGNGMNLENLIYTFTHIGGSIKEDKKTNLGRDMIGRLGIGMLSVASACKGFRVRTKKTEEQREYIADISLNFFDDLRELTETMDKFNIGNVHIRSRSKPGYDKYTIVEINDFRPPFLYGIMEEISKSYFYREKCDYTDEAGKEKYVVEFIEKLALARKIGKLPPFDEIITELGLMAPVRYLSDGPVRQFIKDKNGKIFKIPGTEDKTFIDLKRKLEKLDFKLLYEIYIDENLRNEFEIFKPLRYPLDSDFKDRPIEVLDPYVFIIGPEEKTIENEPGEKNETLIRGYLYHQNSRILPHEFRGILFRVYNVAIGRYFEDELRLYSEDPIILHQMLIEVYLDKGFQSIVNLDRESLFAGARTYQYLRAYLENLLKGKAPPKGGTLTAEKEKDNLPKTTTQTTEGLKVTENLEKKEMEPINRDVRFYEELRASFPERTGIIKEIKSRMETQRKERTIRPDPVKKIEQKLLDDFHVDMVELKETKSSDEVGYEVKEDRIVITIPEIKGSNSKLWEGIFMALAVWGPKDKDELKNLVDPIYDIYKTTEN